MKNRDNGAYACASENGHQLGLTKREHFAGLAMQGMLSNSGVKGSYGVNRKPNNLNLSLACVAMADALLEALECDNGKL